MKVLDFFSTGVVIHTLLMNLNVFVEFIFAVCSSWQFTNSKTLMDCEPRRTSGE